MTKSNGSNYTLNCKDDNLIWHYINITYPEPQPSYNVASILCWRQGRREETEAGT